MPHRHLNFIEPPPYPVCTNKVYKVQLLNTHPSTRFVPIALHTMYSALFLLVSCPFSLAAPATDLKPRDCHPIREPKTAKYDDLPFYEGSPNPIPPHYYGLSYFDFQIDQYDGFIPPTSGNQTAIAFGGSGNFSVPDSYRIPPHHHRSIH
jgi:hypothetical protein